MNKKKVLFLGSSHTFNVGLHTFRYMDYDLLRKQCQRPYEPNMNLADYKFIYNNRWTKIVSDYLNCVEINVAEAGGSPAYSLEKLLKLEESGELENIEYIFFEFFSIYRLDDRYFKAENYNDLPRTPGEIEQFLKNPNNDKTLKIKIEKWLIEFDPYEFMGEVLDKLHETIQRLNNKKFIILLWANTENVLNNFDFDENERFKWITDYTPKFPTIDNKNNDSVHNWLYENKWTIEQDHPFWGEDLTSDLHPSLTGSKKLAECLIHYINEKYKTN